MTESSDRTLPVPPPSSSSEVTLDVALPFPVEGAGSPPLVPSGDSKNESTVIAPLVAPVADDATANVSLEWLRRANQDREAVDAANEVTLIPGPQAATTIGPATETIGQIGDYDLLREIARGGMGVVYLARQRRLNRLVALKMILAGQLASSEEVRRFYAEAEAVAKLEHPNIVSIFEVGQVASQHFYSMGFVDGPSLSKRLQDGAFSSREAAELMLLLAEAMEYAHQNGIIHRDLKPANVLLSAAPGITTKSGNASALGRSRLSRRSHASSLNKSRSGPEKAHFEFVPKITDFGLAKQTTLEGSGATVSGQIMGTPSYMPPEQAWIQPRSRKRRVQRELNLGQPAVDQKPDEPHRRMPPFRLRLR